MSLTVNVQWKGTDACLDLACSCGQYSHIDGFTFAYIKCFKCGQNYKLDFNVSIEPVDESEIKGGGLIDAEQLALIKEGKE